MNQPFSYTGQSCLVTGAGSGIGEAVARALALQGGNVAVNDIRAEQAARVQKALTITGARSVCVPGDVATQEGAVAVVQAAIAELGRLDVLVNCAAAPVALRRFWETEPADWSASLSSFYAALFCTRAALGAMLAQRYGRIVNVTSIAGAVGVVDMAVYGAAKGALHAFTRALAKEVASHGITVNCVAPGTVDTPRQRSRPAAVRAERERQIPLGRFATPEEVAWAVVYLASR